MEKKKPKHNINIFVIYLTLHYKHSNIFKRTNYEKMKISVLLLSGAILLGSCSTMNNTAKAV